MILKFSAVLIRGGILLEWKHKKRYDEIKRVIGNIVNTHFTYLKRACKLPGM